MKPQIRRHRRRNQWEARQASVDPDTLAGTVYTPDGAVEVFSYRSGKYGPAFTALDVWIPPYEYRESRPLSYGRLSLMRMARRFAARCAAMARGG